MYYTNTGIRFYDKLIKNQAVEPVEGYFVKAILSCFVVDYDAAKVQPPERLQLILEWEIYTWLNDTYI